MNEIRWTGRKVIEWVGLGVGISTEFSGERFDIFDARDNGYGGVILVNHTGRVRQISLDETIPAVTTFNL